MSSDTSDTNEPDRPDRTDDGGSPDSASRPLRHEQASRDAARQYVLPLVVRIEKASPPARTDALETAARAVLVMLSDERSLGEGEWAQAMRDWQDAQIRKVVRRARGAEWRRATALPGLTVTGPGPGPATATGDSEPATDAEPAPAPPAEVRVFPPVPLDGWPKELAKLQVSGTDLADPEPPPAPDPAHPVLWLNPELDMSAGKTMAQVGHGAQLAWWELSETDRKAWREAGFPLAVRTAEAHRWRELTAGGLPVVHDAGFTEIAPGETVAVEGGTGFCPLPRERLPRPGRR